MPSKEVSEFGLNLPSYNELLPKKKRFLDQLQMEHSQRSEGWYFLLRCCTVNSAWLLVPCFSEDVDLLLLGRNIFPFESIG